MKFEESISSVKKFAVSKSVLFFNCLLFNLTWCEAFCIKNVGLTTIEKILRIKGFADKNQSYDNTQKSQSQQYPNCLELLLNIGFQVIPRKDMSGFCCYFLIITLSLF